VKEQLLAGGEDEVLPAIHAFEYLVLEFHDPVACRRTTWPATPALLENRTDLPGPGTEWLTATATSLGGGKGLLEGIDLPHAVEPGETPRARDCLKQICGPGVYAVLLKASALRMCRERLRLYRHIYSNCL
jgi:hypothetical protein